MLARPSLRVWAPDLAHPYQTPGLLCVRASPRIDQSADVLFLYDQLAVQFIEELNFDYNAIDAMAVLLTAAA